MSEWENVGEPFRSAMEIALHFGLSTDAVRKRIERVRDVTSKACDDAAWKETANPRANQPRFSYDVFLILPLIIDLFPSDHPVRVTFEKNLKQIAATPSHCPLSVPACPFAHEESAIS